MVMPGELKWVDVPSLPPGRAGGDRRPDERGRAVHRPPQVSQGLRDTGALASCDRARHGALGHVLHGRRRHLDRQTTHALPAGAIGIIQPGAAHYAWTEDETIVQLNGTGPWGINYVDPKDDPRKSSQR